MIKSRVIAFTLGSAVAVSIPVMAEETIGEFLKNVGRGFKEGMTGTANDISDRFSDAQQQIFRVNDGSSYHCIADPSGKFYPPGKAKYGHVALQGKKLVFIDGSAQQVGDKIRIDVLKSLGGGDCAKLQKAGKLVLVTAAGVSPLPGAVADNPKDKIIGYHVNFAHGKCWQRTDAKHNTIEVRALGTELTDENCRRIAEILGEANKAYERGDRAESQRLSRDAEAYEVKAEVENLSESFSRVDAMKAGSVGGAQGGASANPGQGQQTPSADQAKIQAYTTCLSANVDNPKICNALLEAGK